MLTVAILSKAYQTMQRDRERIILCIGQVAREAPDLRDIAFD
jgi:hypothetical protein